MNDSPLATAIRRGRILNIKAVAAMIGLAPSTIRRAVKAGTFPPPMAPTKQTRFWLDADVIEWIAAKHEAAR